RPGGSYTLAFIAFGAAFCATFACGKPKEPVAATTTTTAAALTTPAVAPPAVPIPEVTVEPLGERRLTRAPALLGAKPPIIRIHVRNKGTATLDVSDFHADLRAIHESFKLRCGEEAPVGRDASRVEPGEAAVFDRAFDCVLPLSGRYDATVIV